MEWHGDYITQKIEDAMGARVYTSSTQLKLAMQRNIAIPVGYGQQGRSQPGQFPRKETGQLWESVAADFGESDLLAQVGSDVSYGKHLEFGTVKMAPRPWCRRTLAEMIPSITRQLLDGAS